ncbi:MAG TPA: cytochrome c [Candidatus Limnocylindrales bacterium]|nr:cytochrome c [Candidatus Limnocylindrales bacterium]
MEARIALSFAAIALMSAAVANGADSKLPAGPIHDRHELMERIGGNAKIIGDAMKAGDLSPVPAAADKIKEDAAKALPLFPEGSTHESSRALPAIWEQWPKFEASMKDLEDKAGKLAEAARSGGDVGAASKAMFGNCKSCHDQFRKPDEDEKS